MRLGESVDASDASDTMVPKYSRMFTYGATSPLAIRGSFVASITANKRRRTALFIVVQDERARSLLGSGTATDLGLLEIVPEVTEIRSLSCTTDPVTQILAKYDKAFQGVGKLRDFSMQIHVDPSVTPFAQPPRRIPFQIRAKVDN